MSQQRDSKMRWAPFCLHKPSPKLFLACSLTFAITVYWFWDGCELPARKSEEIRGLPLTLDDCSRLISKTSSEREEGSEKTELNKATDQKLCEGKHVLNRITVVVNKERKIEGRVDGNEVFVPFSFIKEYFEIYGDIQDVGGQKVLDWRHSSFDVHTAVKGKLYEPRAPFLWFETYHVEGRSRVKCISGVEEVPVSSQWNQNGHFYPVQIAQYGLSHYNMLQIEGDDEGTEKLIEDAESTSELNWKWATSKTSQIVNVFDKGRSSKVIQFSTPGLTGDGITLSVDSSTKHFYLSFDLQLRGDEDVRVSVVVETDNVDFHTVHFTTNRELVSFSGPNVYYGIGRWKGWRRIVRNLDTDLRKGVLLSGKKSSKKGKLSVTEIQSITLRGQGAIDNITLAQSAHAHSFLSAANWFIRNQNDRGGWPITVVRKVIEGVALYPDWYSAMAQGQAMSLLTRAFLYTKNEEYLRAASKATKLFKIKSKDKGVQAVFMNQLRWYEEYPTTPSLFVLNGFIFSLLGLYDLKLTAKAQDAAEPAELFDQGMRSLKTMLPLYDSGSGSFYDLRHVTMRISPNLARWDYHTLHVSLLYFLATIDPDPIFKTTATRWEGYSKGKRAKHN